MFVDKTCPTPPSAPTSREYLSPAEDGRAVIESVIYPTTPLITRNDMTLNSSHTATEFPSNYLTNIT
jgi:hypothetical protein